MRILIFCIICFCLSCPNKSFNNCIAGDIIEAATIQGTITNHVAGETYTISAVEGTISNAVDNTFDYTAPVVTTETVDTISIIGTAPGDEASDQLDTNITIDNTITITPTLSIASNIIEETLATGTITNYIAGTTYTISAILGTISNIVNDTFDYTAPAVTEDTPDTISIIAHVVNDENSTQLDHDITIDNRITPTPILDISNNGVWKTLTWDQVISTTTDVDGYNIYCKNSETEIEEITKVGDSQNPSLRTKVDIGIWDFTATAYNKFGESLRSNIVTCTIQ